MIFEGVGWHAPINPLGSPINLRCVPQLPGQRAADLVDFVVKHYPEAVRAALAGEELQLALFS